MDELPIGRRVAYWRNRRKMSQQVFADRLGKSKSWVDKVERGVRRLDKFSVVYEIADVLQVDVQLLLGKDPERRPDDGQLHRPGRGRGDPGGAGALRPDQRVLLRRRRDSPPLTEMRKAVSHAWLTYQHAKYGVLARSAAEAAARRAGRRHAPTPASDQARDAAHLLGAGVPDRLVGAAQARRARAGLAGRRPVDRGVPARRRPAARRPGHLPGRQRAARARPGPAGARGQRQHRQPARARRQRRRRARAAVGLRHAAAAGRDGRRPDRRQRHRPRPARAAPSEAAAATRRRPQPLLDLLRPDQRAAAPGRRRRRARRGRYRGRDARARSTRPRSTRCCPSGGRTTTSTSPAATPRSATSSKASEMLLEGDRLAPSEIRCRPLAHEVLSDVLRRTRGTPPAPVAELAEHMGVGV